MKLENSLGMLLDFDPEIREIEKEMANFFAEKGLEFNGRHPHVSTILVYFYTRKKLTQKGIQILTKLSAGSVSKAVRQLVQMNIITQGTIPRTHTRIYGMESLPFISPRFFLATGRFIGNVEKELSEMKEILDKNREEMKRIEGYDKIYKTIIQILDLIPLSDDFMLKLEKELTK